MGLWFSNVDGDILRRSVKDSGLVSIHRIVQMPEM